MESVGKLLEELDSEARNLEIQAESISLKTKDVRSSLEEAEGVELRVQDQRLFIHRDLKSRRECISRLEEERRDLEESLSQENRLCKLLEDKSSKSEQSLLLFRQRCDFLTRKHLSNLEEAEERNSEYRAVLTRKKNVNLVLDDKSAELQLEQLACSCLEYEVMKAGLRNRKTPEVNSSLEESRNSYPYL